MLMKSRRRIASLFSRGKRSAMQRARHLRYLSIHKRLAAHTNSNVYAMSLSTYPFAGEGALGERELYALTIFTHTWEPSSTKPHQQRLSKLPFGSPSTQYPLRQTETWRRVLQESGKMGKKYKRGTCPSCLGDKFISRANGTCNQCARFKKSRPNYHVYIRSDLWQLKSYQAKRRARFKCEECGKKPSRLETHHKTYARLGNERDDDLIVLCSQCHDSRHIRKTQQKQSGVTSATVLFDNGPK